MGEIRPVWAVKLFCAITFQPSVQLDSLKAELTGLHGPIEREFGPIPFGHSDYYAPEMGEGLLKTYLVFAPEINRNRLAAIKHETNALEARLGANGRRSVNLDPGYIARDKLVLASTKDFFHRISIGEGIFAEVTLHFRKGVFRHFSWTYPDFRDKGLQAMLMAARADLVGSLRRPVAGLGQVLPDGN